VRQWIILGALSLAACSGGDTPPTGTTPPGPVAQVSIAAVASSMVAGGTQQLTARLYDKDGKAVTTSTVTWSATPATVGTVSSAGVLTAVAPGTVKVTATSGTLSSTVDILVEANPCTTPIALQAGQVRTFTGGGVVSCITLAASAGSSDYLVIGANTRPVQDDLMQYSVSLQSVAASLSSPVVQAQLDPRLLVQDQEQERIDGTHERLRQYERATVGPVVQAVARTRTSPTPAARANLAVSLAVSAVGDTVNLRVPNLNTGKDICKDFIAIKGVVRASSTRATIVEDVASPSGGFTTTDYNAIAQEFDNLIFPTDTSWFGKPTDINSDGRVTILYTPEVNKLTPSGSSGFTAGFFFGSDLIKKDSGLGFSTTSEEAKTFEDRYQRMKGKVLSELKNVFKPEFLNRIDSTVVFRSLSREDIRRIVDNELRKVEKTLLQKGIRLEVTDAGKDWLGEKGYDPTFGARPLRRVIQDNIEDRLSEMLLSGDFGAGDLVKVDSGEDGLIIEPVREPAAVG